MPYIIYFCSSHFFGFVKTQWRVIDFEYPRSNEEQTQPRIDIPPYAVSFWASSGQSYCVLECQLGMWSQCLYLGVSVHWRCCDGPAVLETRLTCIYTTPDSTSHPQSPGTVSQSKQQIKGWRHYGWKTCEVTLCSLISSFPVCPDSGHSIRIDFLDR